MTLTWSMYVPLILAGIAYAAISIAAGVVASRGNVDGAERLRDVGFIVLAGIAVWTAVLLLLAIFSEPDDVWDMVIITLVIVVFFAIVLVLFFGLSLLSGLASRMTSRRRRVTTDDL